MSFSFDYHTLKCIQIEKTSYPNCQVLFRAVYSHLLHHVVHFRDAVSLEIY